MIGELEAHRAFVKAWEKAEITEGKIGGDNMNECTKKLFSMTRAELGLSGNDVLDPELSNRLLMIAENLDTNHGGKCDFEQMVNTTVADWKHDQQRSQDGEAIGIAKLMLGVETLDIGLEARIRRVTQLVEKVCGCDGGTLRSRQVVANIIADWEDRI